MLPASRPSSRYRSRSFLVLLGVLFVNSGCAIPVKSGASTGAPVASVTQPYALEPLPAWANDVLGADRFLDIDRVMKGERLDRRQAVEFQAIFRGKVDEGQTRLSAFEEARAAIRKGETASGWKPVVWTKASEFLLVLDMDETLLQQWYASGKQGFADLKEIEADGSGAKDAPTSPRTVKFAPHAEDFIRKIRKDPHCRGVVIYTGKVSRAANDIVDRWTDTHLVDGVFSRDHLVMGSKNAVPSKDLRIFDPDLQHVLLVDDNPARVLQPKNLRAQPKFDADRYFRASNENDTQVKGYYEALFGIVGEEITESAQASDRLGIPFSQAFLPYSYPGERVVRVLSRIQRARDHAIDFARMHPEFLDAVFYKMP